MRITTQASTPFAMRGYPCCSTGGIISRKVSSRSDSRNGSSTSRTTYRSKILIGSY